MEICADCKETMMRQEPSMACDDRERWNCTRCGGGVEIHPGVCATDTEKRIYYHAMKSTDTTSG